MELGFGEGVLHAADSPALQADFDAVRMRRGTGQNLLHDTARQFPRPLVFFSDNIHLKPLGNVFPILSGHTSSDFFYPPNPTLAHSRECASVVWCWVG